jgi:predicted trehalose synthase
MPKLKQNSYRTVSAGVLGGHEAMRAVYLPKVRIADSILRLSAASIAQAFGVVGKAYIEGCRHAMILELNGCQVPLSSWREVADRVKGRTSLDYV